MKSFCIKCNEKLSTDCGTGLTWNLYKCFNCGQLYAEAITQGYIPQQIKEDKTIIIIQ